MALGEMSWASGPHHAYIINYKTIHFMFGTDTTSQYLQ